MKNGVALLLVFVFLAASLIITAKPVSAATPVENSWVSEAPMQLARGNLGVVAVNGKVYAIGGFTKSDSSVSSVVGTSEEYDPATDAWTFKTPMPTPRYCFAIATYQDKIYCIGGYTSDVSYSAANEVYNPATNTWETKASMPTRRSELQANVVNGAIYLLGGVVPSNSPSRFSISSLNEVYDPATDSWSTQEPMPFAAYEYASSVLDNNKYTL
jgi:N-acetylneuraminic acid mutarotase